MMSDQKIIFRHHEGKASCCNDYANKVFSLQGEEGDHFEYGLCALCFVEYLIDESATITTKRQKFNEALDKALVPQRVRK